MKKLYKFKNIYINLKIFIQLFLKQSTSFYDVIGSRIEELGRQFKAGEIIEKYLKELVRDMVKRLCKRYLRRIK